MHVFLKLVNGEQIEQTVDSNVCIIGRSAKCDVVVPHDGMSRQHCQVELIDGEVFLTDLGSTNGVMIDGEKIVPHTKTPYALYLTCSFGAVQNMQIELEELKGGERLNRPAIKRDNQNQTGSTGITNLTKTRVMKDSTRPAVDAKPGSRPAPGAAKKDLQSKSQAMMMNILAVLILAAAIYWYTTKEDQPVDSPEAIETNAPEVPEKTYDQF